MSIFRIAFLVLAASAAAPGNPLFGFRLPETPDPYEMAPIAACEEQPTMSCAIAGRVIYGLRVQTAFLAGAAHDWLAVDGQERLQRSYGRVGPPSGLPFSLFENMSEEEMTTEPPSHDI